MNGMRLPACKAVDEATQDYFDSQSTVRMWVEDCCERIDNLQMPMSSWAKASDLYANYSEWKKSRGEEPYRMQRFSESLQVEFKKARSDGMRFAGLRLKPYPNI